MNFKIKIILFVFVLLHSYALSFADTNEVTLFLDKNEYTEGDTIMLKIEFDFNKGDSIAYFYDLDFLFGVILNDEHGQTFREYIYFEKRGRYMSLQIPVHPNEIKTIETNLTCHFTTENNYMTFDNRCLVNLAPGIYVVRFDDYRLREYLGRNITAIPLTFKILPKN